MLDRSIETVKELAERSGVNKGTLGKVMGGKVQPSAHVMVKLIETLDIPSAEAGQIFFCPGLT
jgi:transcriptional regulator with XRE-family HTH domain